MGLLLVAIALSGCMTPAVVRDRVSACRVARAMLRQPMSGRDLIEVTAQFPEANRYARRAFGSRIAALVLTGLGAAGLVGSFATGFAVDTSQREARIAIYSVVGTTIALGAGALLAGSIAIKSTGRAYKELDETTRAECP